MAEQKGTGPWFGTVPESTFSEESAGEGSNAKVYELDIAYQKPRPKADTFYVQTDRGYYGDGSEANASDQGPTITDTDIGTPVASPESIKFLVKKGSKPIEIDEFVLKALKSNEMKEFVIYMPAPHKPVQVMEQLISVDKYITKEQNSIDLVEFFTAYADWALKVCKAAANKNLMLSDFKPANVACHNLGPHNWAFRLIDLDGITTFGNYKKAQMSAIKIVSDVTPEGDARFEWNKYFALFNCIKLCCEYSKEGQADVISTLLDKFLFAIDKATLQEILSDETEFARGKYINIVRKVYDKLLKNEWQLLFMAGPLLYKKRIQDDKTVPETKS